MTNLRRLTLTNFRNYDYLAWEPKANKTVVFGPNASGKTNLLESLSLLVPGRGLRKSRTEELGKQNSQQGWGIVGEFSHPETDDSFIIATGINTATAKRQYRINGNAISGQHELSTYLTAVWLTPQMDRLFLEGASGRRRFLDQLIMSTETYYSKELAAYEKSLAHRNRLLLTHIQDNAWLNAVEESMARHAVAITAARMNFVRNLNQISVFQKNFPEAYLQLVCPIVDQLNEQPALVVEDYLKQQWKNNRFTDAENKGTGLGCHRTDVMFIEKNTQTSASLASTGQQKTILLSTILKLAEMVKTAKMIQPILLLDEPLTHLDQFHREILLATLLKLDNSVILTGNDKSIFSLWEGNAEFLHINQGKIV